ncbi:FecR family protein [Novosphingobium sp. PhB55]|uniref:FecR family protein n=1 Tax=Novosphingobium sp. TaxID=1874826 RepID=UPI0010DB5EB7|nr:FecR family protein [Novosphingobium sp. PhB55]
MTDPDRVNALDERAAQWALRVDAATLNPQDQAELDAWLAADPRHAGAFARAMAANAYFERAVALGVDRDIPEVATGIPEVSAEAPRVSERRVMSRRLWLGGAAGAMAASLLVALGLDRLAGSTSLTADKGTVRRTALEDGSAVTLNAGTEVSVAMKPLERRISMLAGEANFDVAKDTSRPFIVEAGPVRIRVVGTSFLVHLSELGEVAVIVREGRVEVQAKGMPPALLAAGDRMTVPAQGAITREQLSVGEVDRLGLWQRGEMDLTGLTLGDAARQYALYSDRRIVIDDPQVAGLKMAGVFSTSDPKGFAQAAALAHGLRLTERDDAVVLSRK